MTELETYDFETILETAIVTVLTAANITNVSSDSDPQFQTERPRTNVMIQVGGTASPWRMLQPNDKAIGYIGAYTAQLELTMITGTNEAGKSAHKAYRSRIRHVMEPILFLPAINGIEVLAHKIQKLTPSGTSPVYKDDDGYQTSKLAYSIDFSLQNIDFNSITQN